MNPLRKICCAAALVLLVSASPLVAHPLGNSSITHFDILYVLPEHFEVDLVLDIAEEPARVIRANEIDADKNGEDTTEEQKAWLARKAGEFAPLLKVKVDGKPLSLNPIEDSVSEDGKKEITRLILKIPGFAEMPTYKLVIRYAGDYPAALGSSEHTLTFEDTVYPGPSGLRRILLERIPGLEIAGPRPSFRDEGGDPFIYEQYDPGNLPSEKYTTFKFHIPTSTGTAEGAAVQAQSALQPPEPASVKPVIPQTSPTPATQAASNAPTSAPAMPAFVASLTDPRNDPSKTAASYRNANQLIALLRGRWGFMTLLTVTMLSFTWGAWHALMPGHAKTVVAAYLISQHGTYRHAMILAVIVTLTHTALVVAMGLVIWLYQASHPALGPLLQLWLGAIAGILVAIMGCTLIWRGLTGRLHHHHDAHEHTHSHESRSWLRRLFTHSHPHLPAAEAHDEHHHEHAHHEHHHSHNHEHAHHHHHEHEHGHEHEHAQDLVVGGQISLKLLVMMGVTGGIVPCPTAMIIMLLGIGTNVVPGALYAVGVFSLGLALTLMAIGFLALSSRRFAAKVLLDADRQAPRSRVGYVLMVKVLPAMSGSAVLALGAAITAHYLYLMRTGQPLFTWLG